MEEVKIQGGKVLDACNEVQIQVGVLVIIFILTICEKIAIRAGWQKLAAFRRGRKWPPKFSSAAYLLFSIQMRRFYA